jgi:putative Mn2+ efflux pump MntP
LESLYGKFSSAFVKQFHQIFDALILIWLGVSEVHLLLA